MRRHTWFISAAAVLLLTACGVGVGGEEALFGSDGAYASLRPPPGQLKKVCSGVTCSDRGQCLVRDSMPTCACDEGYEAVGLSCVAVAAQPACGDGLCEALEDCRSCAADCGPCPSTDLIFRFGFDEASGVLAQDTSDYQNHASLVGAGWTSGRVGGGLALDGVDDYLVVADAPSLDLGQALTLELWVRLARAGQTAYLLSKNLAFQTEMAYSLRLNEGELRLILDDVDHPTGYYPPVGGWAHVAITWDGSTAQVFADGELVHTSVHVATLTPNDHPLIIGARSDPAGPRHYLAGSLDEVQLWSIVRTQAEICADALRTWDGNACVDVCGDGLCQQHETCSSCEVDCGACASQPPPASTCGDGVCAEEETCGTCAEDCGTCCADGGPRVFPNAEGFGTCTAAGRGGRVIKVTTLANTGPGSLREAITATGKRTVVFEVAGNIRLSSDLSIREPFITIAGQTAPSPGITLTHAGIRISTNDVLIQHLRIRVGDDPNGPNPDNRDCIQILGTGAYNVVVDHVSASWAIDENVSLWYALNDVTISNSIVAEGLNDSLHSKGPHSKGILLGFHAFGVTLKGNLLAHNAERNPRIQGDTKTAVINNVFYNPGLYQYMNVGDYEENKAGPSYTSVVGNIFKDGPSTRASVAIKLGSTATPDSELHEHDNVRLPGGTIYYGPPPSPVSPIPLSDYRILPSSQVMSQVTRFAGARPADRDAVDERLVHEVLTGTGRIIDSQSEVGGWPALPQTQRPFPLPVNASGDADGDGYTDLEEVLHRMAAEVEGRLP